MNDYHFILNYILYFIDFKVYSVRYYIFQFLFDLKYFNLIFNYLGLFMADHIVPIIPINFHYKRNSYYKLFIFYIMFGHY